MSLANGSIAVPLGPAHPRSRHVASPPWRRGQRDRGRSSREPEQDHDEGEGREDAGEEEAINLTAAPSTGAVAPPLPPFEEGVRTWGELIGILDPMDEPESVIDPLVVENGVDRIRRMGQEERSQLAVQLVRFLAILYAEILRMLQLAEQEEGTSLLQMPGVAPAGLSRGRLPSSRALVEQDEYGDGEEVQLMQTMVDKFGVLLQKLLGLLEKLGQPSAGVRAGFLRSMLADVQRPGTHITAVVIEKMDRLQALLLSFEAGTEQEVTDVDREWCFGQWEALRATMLDVRRDGEQMAKGAQKAASSTDIVCLADSQERAENGSSQVAVLPDGSTRPLTKEEVEEIAFHEQLEAEAAERESQADHHRWLEYKAHCLREEEERDMQAALNASEVEPSSKRARVMVQVEGEGGRVVRSEIFNLVVKEGEALTYKIMVLPRDDPEVRALRRRQQRREGQPVEETDSGESAASAETVRADEKGKALPAPEALTNEVLDDFMKTEEGPQYYRKWLRGELTCAMVRERSGCGLLAKFFGRKVEEEEEEKMIAAAIQAEASQVAAAAAQMDRDKNTNPHGAGQDGQALETLVPSTTPAGARTLETLTVVPMATTGGSRTSEAPTTWPSLALRDGVGEINLDSQGSTEPVSTSGDRPVEAENINDYGITAEENQAELNFAIAAGDIPAHEDATELVNDNEGMDTGGVVASGSTTSEGAVTGQTNLRHWLT